MLTACSRKLLGWVVYCICFKLRSLIFCRTELCLLRLYFKMCKIQAHCDAFGPLYGLETLFNNSVFQFGFGLDCYLFGFDNKIINLSTLFINWL